MSMEDLEFVLECNMLNERVEEFNMHHLLWQRPESYFDCLKVQGLARTINTLQKDEVARDAELMIIFRCRYRTVEKWMGSEYAKEHHKPLGSDDIDFSQPIRVIH